MRTGLLINRMMLTGIVGSGLLVTGCATKKYVRNTVDPVTARVGTVEKKTSENASEIEQVGTSASRANERAAGAERAANDANAAAGRANDAAVQAGGRADQARGLAEQANNRVGELGRTIENMDNYKMVNSQNVLFNFNRADLSKDGKALLDQMLSQVKGLRRYVVEVEGFADRTGTSNYNVSLSERRANAVIRYLTEQGVPLRSIHVLGMGVDQNQDRTRAGRAQARRVEVKVYTPDLTGAGADSTTPTPLTPRPTGL